MTVGLFIVSIVMLILNIIIDTEPDDIVDFIVFLNFVASLGAFVFDICGVANAT